MLTAGPQITYGSLALAVYIYGYWSTWDDPKHKSANRATVAGLLLFALAVRPAIARGNPPPPPLITARPAAPARQITLLLVGNYHEYWTCVTTQLSVRAAAAPWPTTLWPPPSLGPSTFSPPPTRPGTPLLGALFRRRGRGPVVAEQQQRQRRQPRVRADLSLPRL